MEKQRVEEIKLPERYFSVSAGSTKIEIGSGKPLALISGPCVIDSPDAGIVAALNDLHLLAAQVPVGLGGQFSGLPGAKVVPTDTGLAHPLLDMGDVIVQVVIDITVNGFSVHEQTVPS